MNKKWTNAELDFVRNNAGDLTDREGAERLSAMAGRHISLDSYRKKRQLLGQKKLHGRGVCKLEDKDVESGRICASDPILPPLIL